MQLQAAGRRQRLGGCIEVVAEDRMPDRKKVDPQLMAPAGQGCKNQSRGPDLSRLDLPIGDRRLAKPSADHLARAVRPVANERGLDASGLKRHFAPDPGDIGLAHLPPFELPVEVALSEPASGEDHHTRGVLVETMDQKRFRVCCTKPGLDAISGSGRLCRHRQEPRRFLDDEEFRISMDEANVVRGGPQ